jgi:hypothetical protein
MTAGRGALGRRELRADEVDRRQEGVDHRDAESPRHCEVDAHLTRRFRALENRMAHAIREQDKANRHLYRVRAEMAEFMAYAECLTGGRP